LGLVAIVILHERCVEGIANTIFGMIKRVGLYWGREDMEKYGQGGLWLTNVVKRKY
jgi:hypothetical protein